MLTIRNPIFQREISYQQRTSTRFGRLMNSVGVTVLALAFICALAWLLVHVLGNRPYDHTMVHWTQVGSWIIHALTALFCVLAGIDAVFRDNQAVLDQLKLTPIKARTYLWGKWWATVHQMRGWMLALGLAQLALVGFMMSYNLLSRFMNHAYYCRLSIIDPAGYGGARPYYCDIAEVWFFRHWGEWTPRLLPLALALAILLTLLEVMTSAMIGIGIGALIKNRAAAVIPALLIRFIPVVVFAAVPPRMPMCEWGSLHVKFHERTWFTLADGGTTALMRMVENDETVSFVKSCVDQSQCRSDLPLHIFKAAAGAVGLFAVLFVLSLAVGHFAMRRDVFARSP